MTELYTKERKRKRNINNVKKIKLTNKTYRCHLSREHGYKLIICDSTECVNYDETFVNCCRAKNYLYEDRCGFIK